MLSNNMESACENSNRCAADDFGCQAITSENEKCGEIKSLDILKEFQQLYENKLNAINDDCDCQSAKVKNQVLKDWVKDLTEQNTLLVQVVEELEHEASERVALLEDKLKNSSKTSFEIMQTLQDYDAQNISNQSDFLKRMMHYQSDIHNLIEYIRRIRDDGTFNTEGLNFYNVAQEDIGGYTGDNVAVILRNDSKQKELEEVIAKLNMELSMQRMKQNEYEEEKKINDKLAQDQHEEIDRLSTVIDRYSNNMPDRQKLLEEIHELRAELKARNEDLHRVDTSIKDMREALTAEVADKHDKVVVLRHECQLLEERCRQADKQTHFKDDIIKEMRKELKQFRSKYGDGENCKDLEEFKTKITELEEQNCILRLTMSNANAELNDLRSVVENYSRTYEDERNKITGSVQNLFQKLKTNENNQTNIIIKYGVNQFISIKEDKYMKSITDEIGERATVQNNNQRSIFNNVENKFYDYSDTLLLRHANTAESIATTENSSQDSDNDFNRTLYLLKAEINKMVRLVSEQTIDTLKSNVNDVEHTMIETCNKDKLIRNKDEMIKIQNDSIVLSQQELKALQNKIVNLETDREIKIQEIKNLNQALHLNQNSIEELKNSLRNCQEKGMHIQQTADLYMESIQILENAKHKAETEVEQQRITIGNLQEALVSVKQQLQGVHGRNAADLKEKSDIIYSLYLNLSEMQTQYMDCYEEIMKLTQTAECLRNSNLELKVINTDLEKDISELNIQLAKSKDIIQALEENIKKILCTNEILEDDITFMNTEMKEVSKELKILQKLLKKNDGSSGEKLNLTRSIHILQEHSESLVEQLKLTQNQVLREMNLNQTNSFQILDLQKQVDLKIIELQRSELELKDAKSKLNISMRRIQDYENKISFLEKQINEFHVKNKNNELKNEEIVLSCNSDVNCLKQKIEMLTKLLNEKSTEILKLHLDLNLKSDTVSKIITENTELQENHARIALNIMNLEKQLSLYKARYEEINSKYLSCQTDLETLKVITSSQEDIKKDRTILLEKLEGARKEENKLIKIINELKLELEEARFNIKQKDEDLNSMNSNQQEILSLKEEINRFTKIRSKLLSENQKLQEQISKLNVATSQFENRNILISEQLEKCIEELNSLQSAKIKLEERNMHLESEIGHFQKVFGELNQEIRYKHESVINLEHELSETKCSRDEICAESRIVVNNVRAWLEEHKRLNVSLNNTVKEKNIIIEELTLERNLLLKNIKEVCERYEILTEELHVCRQYLAEMNSEDKPVLRTPLKRSVHTWGSQGSALSYESNSPMIMEPGYDYNYMEDEQPTQDHWMRKINNLSDDVQESKKYWKRRLSSTNKRDNKNVKIKDSSSMKTN